MDTHCHAHLNKDHEATPQLYLDASTSSPTSQSEAVGRQGQMFCNCSCVTHSNPCPCFSGPIDDSSNDSAGFEPYRLDSGSQSSHQMHVTGFDTLSSSDLQPLEHPTTHSSIQCSWPPGSDSTAHASTVSMERYLSAHVLDSWVLTPMTEEPWSPFRVTSRPKIQDSYVGDTCNRSTEDNRTPDSDIDLAESEWNHREKIRGSC